METKFSASDFEFRDDFDAMEMELEALSKEQNFRMAVEADLQNALQELEELQSQMPKERTQSLLEACEKSVMNNIGQQFGLSYLVKSSKEGGQVSTTHNVRKGIYANEKERLAYENRGEYDEKKYHQGNKTYREITDEKREKLDKVDNYKVVDYMTGKKIDATRTNLDHKVSAKKIHDDPARVLAEIDGVELANRKENLALTDSYLNSLKSDNNVEQFHQIADKKIQEFENKQAKGTLSETDRENLKKLKSIKWKELENAEKENRKVVDKQYYTSLKPYKEIGEATLIDATNIAKGSLKSAIAIVLSEFAKVLFGELRHIFKNFGDESFSDIFKRLKSKLGEAIKNIKDNFKDNFEGSIEQAIGAFLSNIVLFVINIFVSTAKRVAQIVRAGFSSLVKAIKILANPPKDMPKDEVAFEALKVLTAGIITACGFLLEETIDKFITTICPFLAPISEPVAVTLSAIIGGVLSTIALYYMDKWFNANKTSNLQIQIMTKKGEIVSYKIAQTWFVMKDSFEYLANTAQRYEQKIVEINHFIKDSGREADSALDELDLALNQLESMQQQQQQRKTTFIDKLKSMFGI